MRGRLALNALNFLTAAVQAGFGPFIAVWLTMNGWSLGAIGLALGIGAFMQILAQVPGGLLVDHIHNKFLPAACALAGLGVSALLLCFTPAVPVVWAAEAGHALASAVMTPALAALTLSLCGHGGFSQRIGVNNRYASLGNAAAAALLGLAASAFSERAVFLLTAGLVLPALGALLPLRAAKLVDREDDHQAMRHPRERKHLRWQPFRNPALHVFAVAVMLFQVANAALLPVALNGLTRSGLAPGYLVSMVIILPQVTTALVSPRLGTLAQRFGRRPVLVAGFAAVPLRAVLIAFFPGATPLIVFQTLDGLSAAVFGLMLPLIAADLTKESGFLNLAIGSLGLASGLGAAFSTIFAGAVADRLGEFAAFLALAGAGSVAVLILFVAMPETRPARHPPARRQNPAQDRRPSA